MWTSFQSKLLLASTVLLGVISTTGCSSAPGDESAAIGNTPQAVTITETRASTEDVNVACSKGTTCNLDDTLKAAMGRSTPQRLLLAEGNYTLSQPLTGSITIQAKSTVALDPVDPSSGKVSQVGCATQNVAIALPVTNHVTVRAGDNSAIQIATRKPDDLVVFRGIDLISNGPVAAQISAGKVQISRATVTGTLAITKSADVSIADTLIKAAIAPSALGATRARGSNDMYLTANDCRTAGISVTDGARWTGWNVAIAGANELGLCVSAATATMCNGSIYDTFPTTDWKYGRGAEVVNGGKLTFSGTRIYNNYEAGALASDTLSTLTLSGDTSVETQHRGGTDLYHAVGVMAQQGATVAVTNTVIRDNAGPGIMLASQATGTVSSTIISGNSAGGVVVDGANLNLSLSRLEDTVRDPSLGLGMGMIILNSSDVAVTDSAFARNVYAGVWVSGDGGAISFSRSTFSDHKELVASNGFTTGGNAIFADGRCTGLSLGANTYTNNEGPHVFLNASYATLLSSSYTVNGLEFVDQQCTCPATYSLSSFETLGLPDATYNVSLCGPGLLYDLGMKFSMYFTEAGLGP